MRPLIKISECRWESQSPCQQSEHMGHGDHQRALHALWVLSLPGWSTSFTGLWVTFTRLCPGHKAKISEACLSRALWWLWWPRLCSPGLLSAASRVNEMPLCETCQSCGKGKRAQWLCSVMAYVTSTHIPQVKASQMAKPDASERNIASHMAMGRCIYILI